MGKAENSEQFDADILQCKVDILRARNIMPPRDDTTQKNPAIQNSTGEKTQSADAAEISANEDTSPILIEEIPAKETTPLPKVVSVNKKEEAEALQEKSEIPHFDLAEEIMAEQRRITAIKRKGPGQKTEAGKLKPETQPVDHIIEQQKPALSEQEKIIAEIVARDIERLCRGDYTGE